MIDAHKTMQKETILNVVIKAVSFIHLSKTKASAMELDDEMVPLVANPFRRDDDLHIRESVSSKMDLSEKDDVEQPQVQTIELQTLENAQLGSQEDTVLGKEGSKSGE